MLRHPLLGEEKTMKKTALALAFLGMAGLALAQGSHPRSGYVTKDGTYVPPSYATNPDSSRLNNYSTQGNVNPYNGRVGTVNPYTPPRVQQPSCYVAANGQYICR